MESWYRRPIICGVKKKKKKYSNKKSRLNGIRADQAIRTDARVRPSIINLADVKNLHLSTCYFGGYTYN